MKTVILMLLSFFVGWKHGDLVVFKTKLFVDYMATEYEKTEVLRERSD